jgi:hypothetical protein
MGVSDEAKNVIPLRFIRKIKNKNFSPLVNSIRGHTVYFSDYKLLVASGPYLKNTMNYSTATTLFSFTPDVKLINVKIPT